MAAAAVKLLLLLMLLGLAWFIRSLHFLSGSLFFLLVTEKTKIHPQIVFIISSKKSVSIISTACAFYEIFYNYIAVKIDKIRKLGHHNNRTMEVSGMLLINLAEPLC